MLLHMKRTTLVLEDDLFRRLKQEAIKSNTSLKEAVSGLLRKAFHLTDSSRQKPFRLQWKTCRGKIRPGVHLDDRESLFDAMDGRL